MHDPEQHSTPAPQALPLLSQHRPEGQLPEQQSVALPHAVPEAKHAPHVPLDRQWASPQHCEVNEQFAPPPRQHCGLPPSGSDGSQLPLQQSSPLLHVDVGVWQVPKWHLLSEPHTSDEQHSRVVVQSAPSPPHTHRPPSHRRLVQHSDVVVHAPDEGTQPERQTFAMQRIPEQQSLSIAHAWSDVRQPVTQVPAGQPRFAQHSLLAAHVPPVGLHAVDTHVPDGHVRPVQQSLEVEHVPPVETQSVLATQVPASHRLLQQAELPPHGSPSGRHPRWHWLSWQNIPVQQSALVLQTPPSTGLHWQLPNRQPYEQH